MGALTVAITGTLSNAPTDGTTYTLGGHQFEVSYFGNSGSNIFTGGNDTFKRFVLPERRNVFADAHEPAMR